MAEAGLFTRDAVDCLPSGELERRLEAGRPLRVKLGIDPTAPDIHLGHTVVLRKLREFQDAGHLVVLIIGDFTARIGDPSGRSEERRMLSADEIERNATTYQDQAFKIVDRDPERLEVRHNSEWLDMGMPELLALVATTTVSQVLERDDFAKRREAGEPISMLELLYPLLQGYDSVAVRSDLELGGTDQKFNLLLARDIQRAYGVPEQVILTLPLLTGTDGERKMSKSFGNAIGVTEPPDEMYGKTMSLPDEALEEWFQLLLGRKPPRDVPPYEAKRLLAHELVERFHSAADAERADGHWDRVFRDRGEPEQIEEASFDRSDGAVHLPALIAELFEVSRSEARRLIEHGGVHIDDEVLDELDVDPSRLDGRVLRVGRRKFRRLRGR
jgi:tyrosyl-tRNA synthetase